MFSDVSLQEREPAAHPLRKLRGVVDALLATMNREFEAVYARRGGPSVPPEMLQALLLQILLQALGRGRPHQAARGLTDQPASVTGGTRIMRECGDRCARKGQDGLKTGIGDGRNRRADTSELPQASKSGEAACLRGTFSTPCYCSRAMVQYCIMALGLASFGGDWV